MKYLIDYVTFQLQITEVIEWASWPNVIVQKIQLTNKEAHLLNCIANFYFELNWIEVLCNDNSSKDQTDLVTKYLTDYVTFNLQITEWPNLT